MGHAEDNIIGQDSDRTDPFLPAMADEEVVVAEDRATRLVRMGSQQQAPVKWSFTGRREPPMVKSLLPLAAELFPWTEELVLGETAFTARGFDGALAELVGDIPTHNLLRLLLDAYSLESTLFDRCGCGLARFNASRIYVCDENASGIAGHRRYALRLYHLDDFAAQKREPRFELTRGLAKLAGDEMKRRRKDNLGFSENLEALGSVFGKLAKEPSALAEALTRLRVRLEVASLSHTGLVRTNNEDALLTLTSRMQGVGRSSAVFAVADGMGGHNAGEVASTVALELLRLYSGFWSLAFPLKPPREDTLSRMMRQHIALIGNEIMEMGRGESKLAGMGTTVTGCIFSFRGDIERGVPWGSLSGRVFNVGDSRTFLVGMDGCLPLTRDHSLVQELLDAGSISEEEAFDHPQKNVITRALGTEQDVEADIFELALPLDSYLVMASDGLTDLVRPERIRELAGESTTAQELAESYVTEALAAGGSDNITLIVLKPQLALFAG